MLCMGEAVCQSVGCPSAGTAPAVDVNTTLSDQSHHRILVSFLLSLWLRATSRWSPIIFDWSLGRWSMIMLLRGITGSEWLWGQASREGDAWKHASPGPPSLGYFNYFMNIWSWYVDVAGIFRSGGTELSTAQSYYILFIICSSRLQLE